MLRIAVVALALLCGPALAEPYAQQQDKREHMAGSAALTFAASLVLWQTDHPVLYGAMLGLGAGLGKELLDRRAPGNHFSAADLAADCVGVALGAAGANIVLTRRSISLRYEF